MNILYIYALRLGILEEADGDCGSVHVTLLVIVPGGLGVVSASGNNNIDRIK